MKTILSTIITTARIAAGRWFIATVLLSAASVRAAEATFTNVTATVAPGLPEVNRLSAAWGDYDNDGRLDILLAGSGISQLWRNTENGFRDVTATVAPGLEASGGWSVAWGDYDNDGRLDFLLTSYLGWAGQPANQIWRNTGRGFTNVTAAVAPGLSDGWRSASRRGAWADFDNDGRLDFAVTGHANSQLWRNTGSGFTNVTATVAPGLPRPFEGWVEWGDYDNDGLPDLFISGTTRYEAVPNTDDQYISESVAQIWRNTGQGFVNVTTNVAPGLPTDVGASVEWADFDSDGWLDFFFLPGTGPQLWQNTGGVFTNVTASLVPGLPNAWSASVAWADYDKDGRLDFLLTGLANSGLVSQLWRNTGSGFTNVTASEAPSLPGVVGGSVTWADYDNDGRFDFLIAGAVELGSDGEEPDRIAQLWRNTAAPPSPPPAIITGPSDAASPASATLNAQINPLGQTVNAWFIWGEVNYGQVTAAQPMGNGNSYTNFSQTITGLSAGVTYYYRAVASNDQGRVFVGFEQRFVLAPPGVTTKPAVDVRPNSATLNGHAEPNVPAYGWFEWGPTPGYGRVTPVQFLGGGFDASFSQNVSGLEVGNTYYFRAVASNSLGVVYGAGQSLFTPTFGNVTATVAPGLSEVGIGPAAWGDYDNDGRLDLLFTGWGPSGLWRNAESGFTNVTATVAPGLPEVYAASVAWGDYDSDGRLDFLLMGATGNDYAISQVWRNTGSGFTNVTATVAPGLQSVGYSSVAWGDYDNDGRLDFLLTGTTDRRTGPVRPISRLWRNTGSEFTNATAIVAPGLPGVYNGSVAWGDYDNDGRLDFVLTGATDFNFPSVYVSQLWRNTEAGSRT